MTERLLLYVLIILFMIFYHEYVTLSIAENKSNAYRFDPNIKFKL
ncbi:hypothetical protein HMPREF0080_00794 [Anaeroglobus geminatus F0357]|uniref:Uncharacterized protein n=1 Tax=Anaeroglobus geminatus F0357 TaxID=861450 RepID=G9YGM6_9FIRM|nr:hypothetical protein HMPREF0080_00794 [Anaeroglobus geminatus F0357]